MHSLRITLLAAALLAATPALAQVGADQIARLGQDLTPLGAEKAGNAAGTIPAWDGGLAKDSGAFDAKLGYKDPFAADQPLFSISAANAEQYRANLSPGQLAMLKRYSGSWKLNVYPSRRSASYPDKVYAAIKGNAVFFSYDRPHAMTCTLHGGAPVLAGEKWIVTKWLRAGEHH